MAVGDGRSAFGWAQTRVLDRYDLPAESRMVDVPAIGGQAQVLVTGEGPPVLLVIGAPVPAAFWAPLMPWLSGHTLYAVDLPGFGLTTPVGYRPATFRATGVAFLAGVMDALGLRDCAVVTHAMGSLWTRWLAEERPDLVQRQAMVACPALVLGTSAPGPMRLASVPRVGPWLATAPPSQRQAEEMMRMLGEDPRGLEEVRDLLVACEALPGYADCTAAMMGSVMRWTRVRPGMATGPDELRAVSHPVHLVWGREDPVGSPEVGIRCAELMPEASLAIVPGGHLPWLHGSYPVAAALAGFIAGGTGHD
jgi:pimeloyl-ACP methyl ester carboxylesterase